MAENKDRHNMTRAINRAKQGKNVSYATLIKFGVTPEVIAEINTIRRGLTPPADPIIETPLALQEIGESSGTAGIAAAARKKAQLDAELRRAEAITQGAQEEVRQAQSAMEAAVVQAETMRQQAIDSGVTPPPVDDLSNGLTFLEMRSYFEWVERNREQTAEQKRLGIPTVATKGQYSPTQNETFKFSTFFFKTNFGYTVNVVNDHPPAGPIWTALGKVGCQQADENILPCVLKRKGRSNTFAFVDYLKNSPADTVVADVRAMLWWIDRFPGIYELTTPGPGSAKKPLGEQFVELKKQITALKTESTRERDASRRTKGNKRSADYEGDQLQFQEIYDFVWENLDKYGSLQTETTPVRSQIQLFFMMYKQVPIRDDFGYLKIVHQKPAKGSQKVGMPSLFYVPKGQGKAIMYLNQYKTISDTTYGGPKAFTIDEETTKFVKETLKAPAGRPREYLFIKESYYKSDKELPTGPDQAYKQSDPNSEESHLSAVLVKPVMEAMIEAEKTSKGRNKRGTNYLRKAVLNECRMDSRCSDKDQNYLADAQLHARSSAELMYVKETAPYTRKTGPKADKSKLSWEIAVQREKRH
jgi:hypothetical protein